MDGVIVDLNSSMYSMFHIPFEEISVTRSELFKSWLPKFSDLNGFTTAYKMPKAKELVEILLSYTDLIDLSILTSVGQFYNAPDIRYQKSLWLEDNFPELLNIPFVTTSSGKDKAKFAHKNSLLIDDHIPNIEHFTNSGGYAIQYDEEEYFDSIKFDIETFINL